MGIVARLRARLDTTVSQEQTVAEVNIATNQQRDPRSLPELIEDVRKQTQPRQSLHPSTTIALRLSAQYPSVNLSTLESIVNEVLMEDVARQTKARRRVSTSFLSGSDSGYFSKSSQLYAEPAVDGITYSDIDNISVFSDFSWDAGFPEMSVQYPPIEFDQDGVVHTGEEGVENTSFITSAPTQAMWDLGG